MFERALDGEPVPPPGDPVQAAMTHGRRIRRRRGLLAGGSAAAVVVATTLALNLIGGAGEAPRTVSAAVAAAMPADPACTWPVHDDVDDISIFLTDDVTDAERIALREALSADPGVRQLRYESRQQAYERFVRLWKDNPDLTSAVGPAQLPESFRMQVADPADFDRLARTFEHRSGVQDLVGRTCPGERK
jgi:hypothetical protein